MKVFSLLASVACTAVLLANNVMSSPVGPVNKRASTNKVIVGYGLEKKSGEIQFHVQL